MVQFILDILAVGLLIFGLFFMLVGAVGLFRMPDLYNRMHATTKCVTLGISSMLIAVALALRSHPEAQGVYLVSKVVLVILFQFIAAPVGAHLLSKAAHLDKAPQSERTLSDELEEDQVR